MNRLTEGSVLQVGPLPAGDWEVTCTDADGASWSWPALGLAVVARSAEVAEQVGQPETEVEPLVLTGGAPMTVREALINCGSLPASVSWDLERVVLS